MESLGKVVLFAVGLILVAIVISLWPTGAYIAEHGPDWLQAHPACIFFPLAVVGLLNGIFAAGCFIAVFESQTPQGGS